MTFKGDRCPFEELKYFVVEKHSKIVKQADGDKGIDPRNIKGV